MPLWMYCDDTSGNTSKKWNEHNSFLFTLAGLPQHESMKEYNVHFLRTSNIAPPLEMMDGVVQQIEDAQKTGIWAWDCLRRELVLIFPTILALLGDNPMHSEFACHIGLRRKYFCRACWVKGTDAQDAGILTLRDDDSIRGDSPAPSGGESDTDQLPRNSVTAPSANPGIPPSPSLPPRKTRGKYVEDMAATLNRVKGFIKVGKARPLIETMKTLDSYFVEAQTIGAKTKLKTSRTNTGIKDTVQEFFFDKVFESYEKKQGPAAKQQALDNAVAELPSDITSPVWRLRGKVSYMITCEQAEITPQQLGLDPHQDTPVELLHVVLLGFVKYFWRDLISN
ncbi:hypothetical protein BDN70DRAFT_938219 [Pholiota conissans]|uniref:Uncharacterized protein n=1 Tax=Pholiota conissans TaxID=109636 RepID=A0A9P6CSS8_9AGAR|nr:hypothetical protein BDN70DRAFT_938219 [Pholiota conissans]